MIDIVIESSRSYGSLRHESDLVLSAGVFIPSTAMPTTWQPLLMRQAACSSTPTNDLGGVDHWPGLGRSIR